MFETVPECTVAASVDRLRTGTTTVPAPDDLTRLDYRELVDLVWTYEWAIARAEACQLATIAESLRRRIAAGDSPMEARQRCATDIEETLRISHRLAQALVATAQEVCDRHTTEAV